MTDTSELQKLLGAAETLLSASQSRVNVPHNHHTGTRAIGWKIDQDAIGSLSEQLAPVEAVEKIVRETPDLLATISRLTAERDALVEALRPFQRYAGSVLSDARLAKRPDDKDHIYRPDGVKITYGDLRRARALVWDGGGE